MRKHAAVPAFIQRAIVKADRERRANDMARPIRAMFDLMSQGEVLEAEGHPVMVMPDYNDSGTNLYAIAPALRGWNDLWERIDPKVSTYRIGLLADLLERDQPITPRLVEQAREEFENCIKVAVETDAGKIERAIRTTQIAWEIEALEEGK